MRDQPGQGTTLHVLCSNNGSLRQYAKAIEPDEQALAIFEELGDRAGQEATLQGLGHCYESLGQPAKAM